MNVADEFQKVRIFLANDGFVAVLKKVATSFMALVEGNGISSHETPHDLTQRGRAGAKQKVKMIRDQGPGIALGLGFFEESGQAVKE